MFMDVFMLLCVWAFSYACIFVLVFMCKCMRVLSSRTQIFAEDIKALVVMKVIEAKKDKIVNGVLREFLYFVFAFDRS